MLFVPVELLIFCYILYMRKWTGNYNFANYSTTEGMHASKTDFLYLVHGKGSPCILNSIWPKYP